MFFFEVDNCTVHNGATKIVICPEGWDYVIKLPSSKYVDYDYEYDEEDDEYTAEDKYYYFEGALNKSLYDNGYCFNNWDYCAAECAIGYEAEKAGLKDFFVPTYFIGRYKDIPIYIQKKNRPKKNKYK